MRLPEAVRIDLDQLRALPVAVSPAAAEKSFVTLGSIASLTLRDGLNQVSREDSKRRVVVAANVHGRDLSSFVEEAQQVIDEQVRLPPPLALSRFRAWRCSMVW